MQTENLSGWYYTAKLEYSNAHPHDDEESR